MGHRTTPDSSPVAWGAETREAISGGVVQITKTVRLSGESADSIEGAIAVVLTRATASLRSVETYEVVRVAGRLNEDGCWVHEVTVDLTFGVKDTTAHI